MPIRQVKVRTIKASEMRPPGTSAGNRPETLMNGFLQNGFWRALGGNSSAGLRLNSGRLLFLLLFLATLLPGTVAPEEPPIIANRIVDEAGVLTEIQEAELSDISSRLEEETGSQVVVVTVKTTGNTPIEQYSIEMAEKTGIGREGVDDGVLILLATEDRRVRIEVGYGLEGNIPDATANRIIDQKMIPHFKQGETFLGIRNAMLAIEKRIKAEPLPEPAPPAPETGFNLEGLLVLFWIYWSWIAYGITALLGWIAAQNSRYTGTLIWGLLAGMHPPLLWTFLDGYFFLESYIPRFLISLLAFHVTYWLAGGKVSKLSGKGSSSSSRSSGSTRSSWTSSSSWSSSRSTPSYRSSSTSSSSSSGSSSSSSFSGGGGSFGGGGASGSW